VSLATPHSFFTAPRGPTAPGAAKKCKSAKRTLRHAKPEEGGNDVVEDSMETFRWNPAGNQARPVASGRRPEASLAWWWSDPSCEA
jgi:hypothetical protein